MNDYRTAYDDLLMKARLSAIAEGMKWTSLIALVVGVRARTNSFRIGGLGIGITGYIAHRILKNLQK